MSRWAPGILEKVLKMYFEDSMTQQQIATELGIDRGAVIRNLRKYSDPEKHAQRVHVNHQARSVQSNKTTYGELRKNCVELFISSNLTITDIAAQLGTTASTVKNALIKCGKFSESGLKELIHKRAALSGNLKRRGRRKQVFSNGRYDNVYSPNWMTKKYAKDVVGRHVCIACENLCLTELPEGCVVHHVNGDSKDNSFKNLVLMTRAEHTSLHSGYLKGVTTISKESTLKWVEARRQGADKSLMHDIVCSGQECPAASNVAGTD